MQTPAKVTIVKEDKVSEHCLWWLQGWNPEGDLGLSAKISLRSRAKKSFKYFALNTVYHMYSASGKIFEL